ncbi:unnamed protein product [Cuscuta europaea]|uniref:Trimethylguanosine synthase n=1 Tax=Cuscuta europaea TaxID=41803 RepID=A0A9P0ZA15_CUSEU|nr:unnamed protein product [Cuscuta europaea]
MTESSALEDEAPSITALGSLFKLTEVYLSDNTVDDVRLCSPSTEASRTITEDAADSDNSEFHFLPEEVVLAKLMSGMGLPMSFRTKERKGILGGMRKNKLKDVLQEHNPNQEDVQGPLKEKVGENASSEIPCQASESLSSLLIGRKSELPNFDPAVGVEEVCHLSDAAKDSISPMSSSASSTIDDPITIIPGSDQELNSKSSYHELLLKDDNEIFLKEDIGVLEKSILDGIVGTTYDGKGPKGDQMDDSKCLKPPFAIDHDARSDFGHWEVYWDDFYSRNYFHNSLTQECTWDPPPGMEELVYINIIDKPTEAKNDIADMDVTFTGFEESADQPIFCHPQLMCDLSEEYIGDDKLLDQQIHASVEDELVIETICHTSSEKKKRKSRRAKSKKKLSIQNGEFHSPLINEGLNRGLSKYWCQRYSLFTKYDEGIQMDEEGWFSVTPESLAKHHAQRCAGGTVVDLFTGVGGNAIQFAHKCRHVIAIDIDPKKIDYAQHNAVIYGVRDQIDFIRGDSLILAPTLKVDVVYMSPPWGGPDYAKVKKFDIKTMLKPHDGYFLFNAGMRIASKVVMFLPRNVDINQLAEIALLANSSWSLEVEKNFLNGKLKGITAYFIKSSS